MFADNIIAAKVEQPSTVTSNHNKKQSWWWMTCPCQSFVDFFLSLWRSMQWKSKRKLCNRVTSFHQKWSKFIEVGCCMTLCTWWLGCVHQFVANTNGKDVMFAWSGMQKRKRQTELCGVSQSPSSFTVDIDRCSLMPQLSTVSCDSYQALPDYCNCSDGSATLTHTGTIAKEGCC